MHRLRRSVSSVEEDGGDGENWLGVGTDADSTFLLDRRYLHGV